MWGLCDQLERELKYDEDTDIYPAKDGSTGKRCIVVLQFNRSLTQGKLETSKYKSEDVFTFNFGSGFDEEQQIQISEEEELLSKKTEEATVIEKSITTGVKQEMGISLANKDPKGTECESSHDEYRNSKEEFLYQRTHEETDGTLSNDETVDLIEEAINKHSPVLYCNHSKLQSISASLIKSKNKGHTISHCPCIVLYCPLKGYIPLGETPFPSMIDNIPTDVRESYVSPISLENLHDPIGMGSEIGRKNLHKFGSVGIFVTNADNKVGFITSAHTFVDMKHIHEKLDDGQFSNEERLEIVQPSHDEKRPLLPEQVCGYIDKGCGWIRDDVKTKDPITGEEMDVGVDMAYVKLTSRAPETALSNPKVDQKILDSTGNIHLFIFSKDKSCL